MSASANAHLFWITSRAAGTTALIMSSASVTFGLTMSRRLGKGSAADRRAIHEILSLSVMVAIAVHGLTLLGDSYLHPSFLDVTLPFSMGYREVFSTLGIVSGWALILLGLSYYVRARIGPGRWKSIHRFTMLAWAGALVHTLGEGTDAGQPWFLALVAVTTLPALVALTLLARRRGSAAPSAPRVA
jgi:sulfoxide reductase heme-binding subunit YedZ